jgi:hypothetical protein
VRGGPALPGQLPEKFSGMVDVIGRAMFTSPPLLRGNTSFAFALNLTTFLEIDRLSVFPGMAPMNIAEGLRAGGYIIAYPPGLEWIGDVAQKVSERILEEGISNWSVVLQDVAQKLKGKRALPHIRWAIQDGLHRATIHHYETVEALEAFSSPDEEDDGLFI